MADKELELSAKFGLPEVAGFAARVEGRFKATWRPESTRVLESAVDRAGIPAVDLGRRLSDQRLQDAVWRSLGRAEEVSDPEYLSVLGRLIGAALDPALIDEAVYMTSEVVRLEPAHLRVLLHALEFQPHDDNHKNPMIVASISAADIQRDLGVSKLVARAVGDRLAGANFLSAAGSESWNTTQWASTLVTFLYARANGASAPRAN